MFDIENTWELMDAFLGYPFKERRIADSGLKQYIHRPHNLIDIKDSNGNVKAQRLEVVTTPFAKEDVKVTVLDNILTVTCGSENVKDREDEHCIYRGISSQSYSFSLKLTPGIDQDAITAENIDGVLKITLPLKEIKEITPVPREITIA